MLKLLFKCVKISTIGVDKMASTSYSVNLCNHIISSQQDDLFVIFDNFSDKVSDPENNTFFIQNEIFLWFFYGLNIDYAYFKSHLFGTYNVSLSGW